MLQEFINNFHFLRPMFLLGLIPAVLLVFVLLLINKKQSSWNQAIDPALLPYLLDGQGSRQHSLPLVGLLALWLFGTIALAGPAWKQIPMPVQEREDAAIIMLDLSFSMYADDLNPNRMTRGTRKLIDILQARDAEGQTALVVYAGDAHAVTPLTDDIETIKNMAGALSPEIMPVPGSDPVSAINLALELLTNSNLGEGQLLLITDGIEPADVSDITDVLADSDHRLSVMGVGTEQGSPIPMANGGFLRDSQNAIVIPRMDRRLLQQLAVQNGGRYSDIQLGDNDITYLMDVSIFDAADDLVESEREYDNWLEEGPWLLLLCLPLAILAFRRGLVFCFCLIIITAPSRPAMAWDWEDLWQTRDQQASTLFEEEQYNEAAELFKDPAWRASANYRKGDFSQALETWSLLDDPEAHYNRGNALAQLGQYEAAIEAYDQALAQVPDHADARHNKEIVEQLLEQQEQQQQDQQNQGDNQQQQDSDQQDQDQQQQDQNQDQQDQDQQQQDQQNQEQQDQQQDQQNQQEQEQQEQQDQEQEGEQQEQEQQEMELSDMDAEEEQSMQQWLGRIEDDPGELLRNKFRYQSQQRVYQQLQNPSLQANEPEQEW